MFRTRRIHGIEGRESASEWHRSTASGERGRISAPGLRSPLDSTFDGLVQKNHRSQVCSETFRGTCLTCVNTHAPPTYLLGGVPWGYESGDLSSTGFATEINCWSRRRTNDHCRNVREPAER